MCSFGSVWACLTWKCRHLWLILMLAYDIVIGRWAFRMRWRKIFADFDLRQGNYLALGMLWIFLAPLFVFLVFSGR